ASVRSRQRRAFSMPRLVQKYPFGQRKTVMMTVISMKTMAAAMRVKRPIARQRALTEGAKSGEVTRAAMTNFIPGTPRLAVDVAGNGPLVVLMHGIGGNRSNWRGQLPVLAPHFTAVAWDARGYGESEDYAGPLDFGDFSADLLRLLDHFGARAAHLVGLSMGGRIALDFHDRHPERVRSLTLCDTHLGFAHMPEEKRLEFVRLRQEPLLAGKQPRDIAESVARTLVSPRAGPGAYERLVQSMCALHKDSYLRAIAPSGGF